MVFSLTSKKKKNSKIPKPNSKVRVHSNSQRSVTVTNNLILSPQPSQNFPDPSVYQQLSSNRAIFESRKLESACSFLKCLKKKLEKDVDKEKSNQLFDNSTSETITDILDTLIDVSDNITPIISDASGSTKSLYRSTDSDASSLSEKHFNKTMTATNKLLEFANKPGGKATNMSEGNYYFTHKIVANNLEELSMFKNNIKHVGDKIYVDKKLLSQLVELHGLLKDTITKLKDQEDQFLADPKVKEELNRSGSFQTAVNWEDTATTRRQPETSTPISKSPPQFAPDNTVTSIETGSQLLTVAPTPQSETKRRFLRRKSKDRKEPQAVSTVLSPPSTTLEAEEPTAYNTAHGMPDKTAVETSIYLTARQTPTRVSPEASAYTTAREIPTETSVDPSLYATARQTPTKISPESSSFVTDKRTPERFFETDPNLSVQETPCKQYPESISFPDSQQIPTKQYSKCPSFMNAPQSPTKHSPEPSAQTIADQSLTLPKLPFDISAISSQISDDNAFKAGKINKKSLKNSKLEYATLLTAEVPSKLIDYDQDRASTFNLGPSNSQFADSARKLSENTETSSPMSTSTHQEESTLKLAPSKKTCIDATTEFSTSRLISPIRKPQRQRADTRDVAACCGGIKETKTHGTTMRTDISTSTSKPPKRRMYTSTPIPKETDTQEPTTEISKESSLTTKNHRTQTPVRPQSCGEDKSKIRCRDCPVRRKLFTPSDTEIDRERTKTSKSPSPTFTRPIAASTEIEERTKISKSPSPTFSRPIATSTGIEERSPKKPDDSTTNESFEYISTFNKTSPGYFGGLNKCIAELECMKNCLRHATDSKDSVHECIQIYPETEAEYLTNSLPHFHTVIDGVPMVVQFNKEAVPIDNSLRHEGVRCCRRKCVGTTVDDASTCCREGAAEAKQPLPCRLWGTISKNAHEKCPVWVTSKRRRPILKPDNRANGTRRTYEDTTDNRANGTRRTYDDTTDNKANGTRRTYDDTTARSYRSDGYAQREKTKSPRGKTPFNTNRNKEGGYYSPMMTFLSLTSAVTDSSPSIPYVADKVSLPKIDDPDKVCSSLQFDVRKIPVTFKHSVLYHPDGVVNKALKDINVHQLLDSFRPAKCCRKTVLNEKSQGPLPYSASLQSLPLVENDLRKIREIMQSKMPELSEKQSLYEHYINFQKNITPVDNKDNRVAPASDGRVYQVYIFEFLRREDDERSNAPGSSRSGSNNTLHDLRIFDFIRKIYTSDPIYDKVWKKHSQQGSREDGDKNVKGEDDKKPTKTRSHERRRDKNKKNHERRSSSHRSKYKKTETTNSYYSSVESYTSLKSKSNCFSNSSISSLTSATKYTKSRNSNSMYSFLLIPKGEFNVTASNNDLSTSYAPSVNSLPFEDDDLDQGCSSSNYAINNLTRPSSEEGEEWLLSPKNYAKTLDGIYELDEHGSIRMKDNTNNNKNIVEKVILPLIQNRQELPFNSRNLSTIYETDEKSINKESDANIFRIVPSKSYSVGRSRSVSPKSSATIEISSKSRIPISIRSHSSSAIYNERTNNNVKSLSKPSTISNRSSMSSNKNSGVSLPESNKFGIRPKLSRIPLQSSSNQSIITKSYKSDCKVHPRSVDATTSTNDIYKDLIARVHPKIINRQTNTKTSVSVNEKPSIELQKALDGTSNFELPITFEIVKPKNNANRNIKFERKVMSYDNESLGSSFGINDKRNELNCYRDENVNPWPQMQKKFEISKKALYVSAHRSFHDSLDHDNAGASQMQILQRHPSSKNIKHTATASTISQNKSKQLNKECFLNVSIASERESKSILKKPAAYDKFKNSKLKKKVKHWNPEVIDIKVSKDIKSTKLKHRFFKDGERPGYVTVLSTPCNCPDITIFLPCYCGYNEGCEIPKHSSARQPQHYAMIPIIPKDQLK